MKQTEPLLAKPVISSQTLLAARWVAICGQTSAVFLAYFGLGMDFPIKACLLVIGVAALLNLFSAYNTAQTIITRKAIFYLSFDILQLSLLLFLTGGLANPFFMLLLCPVAIGATMLPLRQIVFLIFLSVFNLILLAHFSIPFTLPPADTASPHNLILMGHFVAFAITAVFTALFGWRVSDENRAMQKANAAIQTVISQKKYLNSLGAQAAAAAHELGSPLATIAVAAGELANDAGENSPLSEDIQLIISQVERCKRILQEFGQEEDIQASDYILAPLPLTRLINEIAENFGHENPAVTIEIIDMLEHPVIVAQKPEIVHSLGVYIQNAIQRAETYVSISCSETKDRIIIEIQDDGPGFDTEIISSLGQPLKNFTADKTSNKRLGIFIAQNLLEELGARTVYSNDMETGGAVVAIHWAKDKIGNE